MTWELLTKAFFLGVVLASPIGPVGLLCLKKNAESDRFIGLFAALGMAVAYGFVSFFVLFGMKWVGGLLEPWKCPLEVLAGVTLIFMGWKGLAARESKENARLTQSRYLWDFSSSFALTLFNPVPFATFAVTLTTFKILKRHVNLISDIEFSLLISLGTMSFWVLVNQVLHIAKKRSNSDWCRWISQGSAFLLIIFGVTILLTGIWQGIFLLLKMANG